MFYIGEAYVKEHGRKRGKLWKPLLLLDIISPCFWLTQPAILNMAFHVNEKGETE